MLPRQLLEAIYDHRTLVFAHSGAQAYAPGNTLPAFEMARQQKAHGVELDVHRSRDGYPVVIHDATVDAATDGTGSVADMTLAQLRTLDAGIRYAPQFAGTCIPTLDEVFDVVGREMIVNVELKSESAETDGLEQTVADCIRRHAMQDRVLISSFNPFALRRFRAIMPEAPIGFLFGVHSPAVLRTLLEGFDYEAQHPEDPLIDAALVEGARRAGHFVNAWTVNDPARAAALRDLGVNGIITDAPDLILKAIAGED